jgi:hypothetical protein
MFIDVVNDCRSDHHKQQLAVTKQIDGAAFFFCFVLFLFYALNALVKLALSE